MAYGSDGDFTAFLAELGLSLPEGTTPAQARALGSTLLDATYGARYSGQVASADQLDEWPRVGAFRGFAPLPSDIVPKGIERAAYFFGQYAANNTGAFFGGGSGSELVKRETVGPLTFEYAIPSNMTAEQIATLMQPVLPYADGLVAPFLLDRSAPGLMILSIGPC